MRSGVRVVGTKEEMEKRVESTSAHAKVVEVDEEEEDCGGVGRDTELSPTR
jgi:hypothetical protein